MMRRIIAVVFTLLFSVGAVAQGTYVHGKVLDENGMAFNPAVNIAVFGTSKGTTTKSDGSYRLDLSPGQNIHIRYSFSGYKPVDKYVNIEKNQVLEINVRLTEPLLLDTFEIVSHRNTYDGFVRVDKRKLELLPTPSGDYVTAFVKLIPGVSSNNEMSSQYSVRGGNFDENLVYVNGIEIHRPVLIRSGQQEGLPFVNPDMVKNIAFSAGGFNATYGDKMSSVLDITYKDPVKFAGGVTASLMGGSVFLQDASKNLRFRYLLGIRYKTNSYLLNSLDTKGDYKPSFTDVQTQLS